MIYEVENPLYTTLNIRNTWMLNTNELYLTMTEKHGTVKNHKKISINIIGSESLGGIKTSLCPSLNYRLPPGYLRFMFIL